MTLQRIKRVIVGRPIATGRASEALLSKRLALPIFSSDALSSVAYATEAALAVLLAASASSSEWVLPITGAIAVLLVLVMLSYRQTVQAYPSGGGAYVVAGENLGRSAGLVAGACLLVDYVLTVAVSVAAGVLAISSAASSLQDARVELSLLFLLVLTVANMRGVREAGAVFALPTYGFVAATLALILAGTGECLAGGCPDASVPSPVPTGVGAVSLIVVLRAFASGSSALTGVEAIANGISAFRRPQAKNAAQTLGIMGVLAVVMFVGVSLLAYGTDARPSTSVSVLSEIGRAVFPTGSAAGIGYYALQGFTFAILVLAANTAFQGMPRLAAVLARDRYLPAAFANLGDRLVYSNGITVLALAAAGLLLAFRANVNDLLHLWLVGVFTAFTLSQAGMLHHWRVAGPSPERRRHLLINGVGAAGTALVAVLVLVTKFLEGAWMVVIAVALILAGFKLVHRHYLAIKRRVHTGDPDPSNIPRTTIVLVVHRLDAATREALALVRALDGIETHAVAVGDSPGAAAPGPGALAHSWEALGAALPLERLDDDGDPADALAAYVQEVRATSGGIVNMILPEAFDRRSLRTALRRSAALGLAVRLWREPHVVMTHVPVVGSEEVTDSVGAFRVEVLVLVREVDDVTANALGYARSLGASCVRAVHVALDPEQAERVEREWDRQGLPLALEKVDAPFRSLETPVLETVRAVTAAPDAIAALVVPELGSEHAWEALLQNDRSVYLEWLLLSESRTVVTQVPLHRPAGGR